jgi:predicted DNA-binding ribbon-helix-helix protein
MGKTVMLDNKMHKDLKQLALDNDTTMIRLINDFIYKK